ncbi:MAG: NAD-dependent succinate-semialdehyde dehydrogenase [Haliscomenobacter sp.]
MRMNYIRGTWQPALSGATRPLHNPATGELLCELPFGAAADYHLAVDAAAEAFESWKHTTPYERAAVLKKAADLLRARLPDIAGDMVLESGKPYQEAYAETTVAANLFEWFAEEGKRSYGRTIPSSRANKRMSVIWQPMGVVGAITAWNFPTYNPGRCWPAILAAGCTLVARSSEYTPLSAMHLIAALHEAGAPPGVVNYVHGDAVQGGQVLLDRPEVRKISFTGSTRVGRLLMDGASRTHTRLALEMGGNAPVIVCPDVDPENAAQEAVRGKFRNAGQVCIAPQRFFIHADIYTPFVEAAIREIRQLRVGNGLDPDTQVGPLIHETHRRQVSAWVARARAEGAFVRCGGKPIDGPGSFFEPCLIECTPEHTFLQEEVFGPVMTTTPWTIREEALHLANQTPYGLAAYVRTSALQDAIYFSEGLEAGIVGVNEWLPHATEAPFGGWKASGIGQESGPEGLLEYMEKKLISIGSLS